MLVKQLELRVAELTAQVADLQAKAQGVKHTGSSTDQILDSITDPIVRLDHDLRFVWLNSKAERLLGVPREQLLGQRLSHFHCIGESSQLEEKCRQALRDKIAVEFESYSVAEDRWACVKAFPTPEGGLVLYWKDITRRKREQAELSRQAHVLAQIHNSVIFTDLQGKITGWNHGAEQIFGYREAEALGQSVAFLYFEEDREAVGTKVLQPLLRQGEFEVELRNRRKSGEECWIRLSLSLLRDEDGTAYGMLGVAIDITDRKRAEEALRESEKRYRVLANAMPTIVSTCNAQGKTESFNQQWWSYSGRAVGDGSDLRWAQQVHADDLPSLQDHWTKSITTGEDFEAEFRLLRFDGEYRWHVARAVPVRNAAGRILEWVATLTDIDARKQTEEALRINEERFRLAMKAVHGLVYELDLRTGAVQRADGLQELIGFSEHESEKSDRWWRSLFHADDRAVLRQVDAYLGNPEQQNYEVEYRIQHADGQWVWVCDRGHVVRDEAGKALRVYGSTYNVTERKRLEANLSNTNKELKFQADILARTVDAVVALDLELRVVFCNAAAEHLFGLGSKEIIGHPISELIEYRWLNPDDRTNAGEMLSQGGTWIGENVLIRRDGREVFISSAVDRFEREQGGGYFAIIRDISGRKQVEQELAKTVEGLKRANEDLLHFAYAVSHDLQTPLRTVNSFANLLARRHGDLLDAEAREFVALIKEGSARMSAMLRDLVRFAKVAGAPIKFSAQVPLGHAVARAVENLRSSMEETGAVMETGPLPEVRGDLSQMTQLFQNLIGNAVTYRKPNTTPHIQISAEQSAAEWVIRVKDNGVGFDPKYAKSIFEVFERLHREESSGTGVGLTICKRIVERCGGRIWAESIPGDGSKFCFALPASDGLATI